MNVEYTEEVEQPEPEVAEVDAVAAMNEAERKHYEDILKLNVLVREAQDSHDVAKSRAKAAKEVLDEYSMRLSVLISEGPKLPDPQKELPFSDAPAWQETPIEQAITVTAKQLEKLHEAGINTVIQFEQERGGNRFAGVKGIGEKTVEEWEAQMLDWMAINARVTGDEE
jgi:DNA uptake protein ComE-like DNA-binding protein